MLSVKIISCTNSPLLVVPLRRIVLFFLVALLVSFPHAYAVDQDDLGTGGDAGDTLAAAAEITLIEGVLEGEGWLDEDDVAEAYHLEVGFHKQVTVARESPEGDNYDLDLHGRYRDLEESSTKPGRWRSRF